MGMERLPRLSKTVAASYNEMGRQRPATAFPFEVKTMLTVAKFGGSSLASAERFLRVREIVRADASRRVVVVSAAGKRHAADHKITDLLYLCHAHLQYGVPCQELWRMIAGRYTAIRDGCGLRFPIERELEAIYASLSPATPRDLLASRGEYLAARLMAELLEFTFVDAADWLRFDSAGNVLREASYAALQSLADGQKIVTPGFYGLLPSGAVHTFPRGGSDVTGSLAAAALHADVCENWTDVPGILAADPSVVSRPQSVPYLSYAELQALSAVGMQVLHESAVEPVRRRRIPLQIRSSLEPELPGTCIGPEPAEKNEKNEAAVFAGRRSITMLRAERQGLEREPELLAAAARTLVRAGLSVVHLSCGLGQLTALVEPSGTDALHAAGEALAGALGAEETTLRENLSLIAALCRTPETAPRLAAAIQSAGVPIHHIAERAPCLLMAVNDSQYETALRAAYRAR